MPQGSTCGDQARFQTLAPAVPNIKALAELRHLFRPQLAPLQNGWQTETCWSPLASQLMLAELFYSVPGTGLATVSHTAWLMFRARQPMWGVLGTLRGSAAILASTYRSQWHLPPWLSQLKMTPDTAIMSPMGLHCPSRTTVPCPPECPLQCHEGKELVRVSHLRLRFDLSDLAQLPHCPASQRTRGGFCDPKISSTGLAPC